MNILLTGVSVALIVSVATTVAIRTGSRELVTKQRLDGSGRFIALIGAAHGHYRSERISAGEQLAAITLITEFALLDEWLVLPALEALRSLSQSTNGDLPTAAVRETVERCISNIVRTKPQRDRRGWRRGQVRPALRRAEHPA